VIIAIAFTIMSNIISSNILEHIIEIDYNRNIDLGINIQTHDLSREYNV
jgi:hypothetical protein